MSLYGRILNRLRPPSEIVEGYEHPDIIETIFQKTIAYRPTGKWAETYGSVLDFGGGCGLHYKEAGLPAVRWAVVETEAMVRRAKELETDRLRFFSDTRSAAEWLGPIDLMHSNGALQYTPDPLGALTSLCALRAQTMIWKRVKFGEGRDSQVSRLQDNGPGPAAGPNKLAQYSLIMVPEASFLAAHENYRLTERRGADLRFDLI